MSTNAPYCGDIGTLTAGTSSSADALHKHTTLDGKAIGTSDNTIPLLDGTNTWSSTQTVNADLKLGTLGNGLYIKAASNSGTSSVEAGAATAGVVTITNSSPGITINTTKVTNNSLIFLTGQNSNHPSSPAYVSARVSGTSFTITCGTGYAGKAYAWMIVEPA